jgi:hypothetical protein
MKSLRCLAAAAVLVALAPAVTTAAGMRDELTIDRANLRVLLTRFSVYGFRPGQSVLPEADGLRLALPGGVAGVAQTGVYSYFALAGDCEVIVTYELLNIQAPKEGYGSGLGLAFDAGDEVGRGAIQRVTKPGEGSGYVLQSGLAKSKGEIKEQYRFVSASAERGQMGLRRVKKDLVFLAADGPDEPLKEVDRMPFTQRTIRAVRLFADAGGSPTAVEVRVREVEVRAEEIAGGEPRLKKGLPRRWWLWVAAPAAAGVLLFGLWRVRRRRGVG